MTLAELLAPIVGPKNCLIEDADIAPYAVDWRGTYRGTPRAVLRPGSGEEVAASVRACAAGEGVRPDIAVDAVHAAAADHGVIAVPAGDDIIARAAGDGIV